MFDWLKRLLAKTQDNTVYSPGICVGLRPEPRLYHSISGPTSIITVREAMNQLADDLRDESIDRPYAARYLAQLADATHRKPPISVAPRKLHELTDETKDAIRRYHRDFPDASQLEIANRYHTNPGRVSEALNEGRTTC